MTSSSLSSRVRRAVGLILLAAATSALSAAQPPSTDYRSKVPQYRFSTTLEAQERELRDNPLLQRMNASRRKLAADPHRPLYHYVNPEGMLNDPNGLCFWQGRWHLFYQAYPPEDPRQHWGHAVSTDLIHWRDLPPAIYPNPEFEVYSGSALVDGDRVIAMYHGTRAGNMVAISKDPLLLNWEKVTGQAVIPMTENSADLPYPIYDPNIWKKDGVYYSLSGAVDYRGPGGQQVAEAFLFRSRDLQRWEYMHKFLVGDRFTEIGDDAACPYFWPIGDRHILPFYSHKTGAQYYLGDYDQAQDKFHVTSHGKFNFGASRPGGVHAPTAAPDGQGGVIVLFNMNQAKPSPGWDQIMTLPRRLTLGADGTLLQEPAGAVASLRQARQVQAAMTLPANQEVVLPQIRGNTMEILVEIDPGDAPMVELNVLRSPGKEEYTRIAFFRERGSYQGRNYVRPRPADWKSEYKSLLTIDSSYSSVLPDVRSRAPETAPLLLARGETLKLRIFIDRSVVEVFANGRQCVALRVYPGLADSTGVSLRSQGRESKLVSLEAWQMRSIYADQPVPPAP